jgi:glycosyltransferase involved in cell wall biosynthesis
MSLFIHAPNVHQGGGAILIKELLDSLGNEVVVAQLDERLILPSIPPGIRVVRVRHSLLSRIRAEWRLRGLIARDRLICFGNLPPLFGSPADTFVFIQNRLLVEDISTSCYPWKVKLRLFVERIWLRLRKTSQTKFIVQTPTMAQLVFINIGVKAYVLPFSPHVSYVNESISAKKFDFVYIASDEAHKNHKTLIEAWCILRVAGIRPSLVLTISMDSNPKLASWIESMAIEHDLDIQLKGVIDHAKVLELYSQSNCQIFPSLFESYGLPLVEGEYCGIPVIAPERDYVRDICIPIQTFDPESAVSISRAVMRFLGKSDSPQRPLTAAEFYEKLLVGNSS